jgi:hypothetical protein
MPATITARELSVPTATPLMMPRGYEYAIQRVVGRHGHHVPRMMVG